MTNPSGVSQLGTAVTGGQRDRATGGAARAAASPRLRGDLAGAALLIAPLAAFMVVFFVVPIAMLLVHAVWDPSVAAAFPRTARALAGWSERGLPPPRVFAAAAADIIAADAQGTLGPASQRLDQDLPGMSVVLMRTRFHLENPAASAPTSGKPAVRHEMISIDSRWANPSTWKVIARDVHPLTSAYMLHAVDLAQLPDGKIVPQPSDQGVYLRILGRTFGISAVVTIIVVLLGYPLAYWLAQLPERRQRAAMLAVLVPFWTSILVRIAAWMVVLSREGIVNKLAESLHLIDHPLTLIYNRAGVIISMVQILIPFMVLPLFAVMRGIPPSFRRAAISLGSHPFGAFWRVYLPQTIPGVVAGALLVFISALGYYIAPALLGGAGDQMLSYYIAYYTNTLIDWGLAAALSALLLGATALLFAVYAMLAASRRAMVGGA